MRGYKSIISLVAAPLLLLAFSGSLQAARLSNKRAEIVASVLNGEDGKRWTRGALLNKTMNGLSSSKRRQPHAQSDFLQYAKTLTIKVDGVQAWTNKHKKISTLKADVTTYDPATGRTKIIRAVNFKEGHEPFVDNSGKKVFSSVTFPVFKLVNDALHHHDSVKSGKKLFQAAFKND